MCSRINARAVMILALCANFASFNHWKDDTAGTWRNFTLVFAESVKSADGHQMTVTLVLVCICFLVLTTPLYALITVFSFVDAQATPRRFAMFTLVKNIFEQVSKRKSVLKRKQKITKITWFTIFDITTSFELNQREERRQHGIILFLIPAHGTLAQSKIISETFFCFLCLLFCFKTPTLKAMWETWLLTFLSSDVAH